MSAKNVVRDLMNEVRSLRGGGDSSRFLEQLFRGNEIDPAEVIDAVRGAASLENAIYQVGVGLWSIDGEELLALEILREANHHGSREAEVALGEALVWMGAYEEAITVLESACENKNGDKAKVLGLLGESRFAMGDQSEAIEELLREGASEYEEFGIDYATILRRRGAYNDAVSVLRTLAASGVFGSALLLGNILDDDLGDSDGARAAYLHGIQSGDAHSAYNLAVLLYRHDETDEARKYLALARRMGDMAEFPDLDR